MSKMFVNKSFVILISDYNSVSQPRNYLTQTSYLENSMTSLSISLVVP